MEREKKLIKNTIIVAIGQICTKFISFFLLPLYTTLLSTEEYGIVDLLNTYISLLLPIIFLQIDQAIFRLLIDTRDNKNTKNKEELISSAMFFIICQSAVYLLIFTIISRFINNEYKFFLATNVIAAIFSSTFLQISRGLGDNMTYSIGSLVAGAGGVILNVIFIAVLHYGAYGMLIATLISNIACTIFVCICKKVYKYIRIKNVRIIRLKNLLTYSVPLIPNTLSWWIVNASDRTIIKLLLNVSFNGIYSAANKFSTICITFFSIFNLTWTESAAVHYKDEDSSEYFSKTFNTTIELFSCICLLVIAIMPFIFKLLIRGEGYADAYYQIPILMIATIFNIAVALFGSVYIAQKKSKEIAKTSIYSAIINIAINLIGIKFIGLYAASMSTLIAYLSMTIYRYFDVQKYVRIKLLYNKIMIIIVILIIDCLAYYLRNMQICSIAFFITVIVSIYLNYNISIFIIKTVKKKLKKLVNK